MSRYAKQTVGMLLLAAFMASLLSGVEPIPTVIKTPAGPSYTTVQIAGMLAPSKLPTGLILSDKQQVFASIVSDLNYQNPSIRDSNHSGFSIQVYEPAAWLGAKKVTAAKEFKSFGPEDVNADDRLSVLRVIVHPDSPEYLTAIGAANANNVEHVVLRSIDKKLAAQPLFVQPTTQEFWSGFGARATFAGLVAVFSMTDLERVRASNSNREFLVTVVGERKHSNRDFEIKRKFFDRLGDMTIDAGEQPIQSSDLATTPFTWPVERVGNGVSQPRVIVKADPEYSELARKAKYSGTVTLSVVVGADGIAHDLRIVKPLGMGLDEKAIEAVQQWKFAPGVKDGQPVNVRATIEVKFRLLDKYGRPIEPRR